MQIKATTKSGIKINDISVAPSEDEALFKPDTKFKITKKEQRSDGTWDVDLEEIG